MVNKTKSGKIQKLIMLKDYFVEHAVIKNIILKGTIKCFLGCLKIILYCQMNVSTCAFVV